MGMMASIFKIAVILWFLSIQIKGYWSIDTGFNECSGRLPYEAPVRPRLPIWA